MTDYKKYVEYTVEQAKNLLAIDSPSGYGREVSKYLLKQFEELGFCASATRKGGVLANLGEKMRTTRFFLRRTATRWARWCTRSRRTAG